MLNPVDYIEQYLERTTRILGINYSQWKKLVAKALAYQKREQQKLELKKVRINAPGGGRKPILDQKEEIGLCLFYLRQMPTFEILGMQFGVSKTEANDTFHKWLLVLRKILPASLLEQLENQPQNREMLLSFLSEIELLVDTERTSKGKTWSISGTKKVLLRKAKISYLQKLSHQLSQRTRYH